MEESQEDLLFNSNFIELSEIGHIQKEVIWCGHKFVLKTLTAYEELIVAKVIREFNETIAQSKATYAAIVAASILYVNGVPFYPNSVGQDLEENILQRFRAIGDWSYILIDELAQETAKLVAEAAETTEELKKKFSVKTSPSYVMPEISTEEESSLSEI